MTSQAPQRRGRADLRVVDARQDIPRDVEGLETPRDLVAEVDVLAALTLAHEHPSHAETIAHVFEVLEPKHFFAGPHAIVFEVLRDMHTSRKPIDLGLLTSELQDRGRLAQVGGKSYVAEIVCSETAVLSAKHVLARCEILIRKWHARATIAASQRIAAEGYASGGNEEEFVAGAAQTMAELHESVGLAKPEGMPISVAVDGAMERVRAMLRGGFGLLTGYAVVDELTGGLRNGEVVYLGAPPKTGKTSFARGIAVNVATSPGQTATGAPVKQGVIFVSLEMDGEDQVIFWACTIARVDFSRISQRKAEAHELKAVFDAMKWLKSLPIVIYGRRSIRYRELRKICREGKSELAKVGAEPRLVMIDHLQLLAKNEPTDPRRTSAEVLGDISREIGNLAAEYTKLPVLVLSQVTEDDKGNMKMRGSGDIEADAQQVWILEVFDEKIAEGYPSGRSTSPREARITVKRARSGPKGSATLWFTPATTSFCETSYQGMNDA